MKKAAALAGFAALAGVAYVALSPKSAKANTAGPKADPTPSPSPSPSPTPTSPTPMPLPVVPMAPGGCTLDANIPPGIAAEVMQATSSTSLKPQDYEDLAVTVGGTYPKAADCLRAAGAARKLQGQIDLVKRGGLPFTIRQGDIPYKLAEFYTGNATRWPEIGALNPKLGSVQTVNGVTNYPHWAPGVEILIPVSWNPLDKGLPPLANTDQTGSLVLDYVAKFSTIFL